MTTRQHFYLAFAACSFLLPVFAQPPTEALTPAQLAARAKARDVPEIAQQRFHEFAPLVCVV